MVSPVSRGLFFGPVNCSSRVNKRRRVLRVRTDFRLLLIKYVKKGQILNNFCPSDQTINKVLPIFTFNGRIHKNSTYFRWTRFWFTGVVRYIKIEKGTYFILVDTLSFCEFSMLFTYIITLSGDHIEWLSNLFHYRLSHPGHYTCIPINHLCPKKEKKILSVNFSSG